MSTCSTNQRLKRKRQRLLEADPFCFYCRRKLWKPSPDGDGILPNKYATIDHLLPLSRGGTDAGANIVLACFNCNGSKSDKTVDEWIALLLAAAERLADRIPEAAVA